MVCSRRGFRGNTGSLCFMGRTMLTALKFLRIVLDRCLNKPLIIVDRVHGVGGL
jgi:hypothetical protein